MKVNNSIQFHIDFPKYQIYSDGRIWSNITNKFLKPQKIVYIIDGYGIRRKRRVHKLVIEVFEGLCSHMRVKHKDNNKNNNHIDNLEYV